MVEHIPEEDGVAGSNPALGTKIRKIKSNNMSSNHEMEAIERKINDQGKEIERLEEKLKDERHEIQKHEVKVAELLHEINNISGQIRLEQGRLTTMRAKEAEAIRNKHAA